MKKKTAQMVEKLKVQEEHEKMTSDNVKGLVQVEDYKGVHIPLEKWNIVTPMDDIILAEYVDITSDGDHIERDGVFIPVALVEKSFRVAKILLKGPRVSSYINVGDYIMLGNDRGIPAIQRTNAGVKKQLLFINEPRIFCIVKPK